MNPAALSPIELPCAPQPSHHPWRKPAQPHSRQHLGLCTVTALSWLGQSGGSLAPGPSMLTFFQTWFCRQMEEEWPPAAELSWGPNLGDGG